MISTKVMIFLLFLFLSLIYESRAQNPLYQNYMNKRPNPGVIDNSNLPYSENQSGHNSQQNHLRPSLFSGFNYNPNGGRGNGGINRGIPIGSYPPPNHMLYGQNGFGFGGLVNNPYQQFPSPHSPYSQIHSQLMPYTSNFLNSLRTGMSAGIPAYGFGYGVIGIPNNGHFGVSNNGYPMSGPYRTTSDNSDNNSNNNDNDESHLSRKNSR